MSGLCNGSPLDAAVEAEWSIPTDWFLNPEPSWDRILSGCTSVRATGCVLCWLVVMGCFYRGRDQRFLRFFNTLALRLTAGSLIPQARVASGVFPIREGDLSKVRIKMSITPYEEVIRKSFVAEWYVDAWSYVLVFGLNSLYGSTAAPGLGRWTKGERRAVSTLQGLVSQRCGESVEVFPDPRKIEKELATKHVGYNGEEVSKCYPLTLEQILPSLPPESHGGCIEAVDWLGPRSREFLLHPERCLLNEAEIPEIKLPGKVHVKAGDELPLAKELVRRGVCRWIPYGGVHVVRGKKLLNGLFGVEKPAKTATGDPVLRVIMNLVPSNACLRQLQGAIESLPSICSWQGIVLEDGEELELHQSDMSSAFYLFKLPESWGPFLAFNIVVPGEEVGMAEHGKVALCANVVPMGWASSVGLMQEMSENLLVKQGVALQHQLKKGRALPPWLNEVLADSRRTSRYWWHVYLDNFCAGERCLPDQGDRRGRICHQEAEAAWSKAGVLSSEKKRKAAQKRVEELGAEVSSDSRTLGVSMERWLGILHVTMVCWERPSSLARSFRWHWDDGPSCCSSGGRGWPCLMKFGVWQVAL